MQSWVDINGKAYVRMYGIHVQVYCQSYMVYSMVVMVYSMNYYTSIFICKYYCSSIVKQIKYKICTILYITFYCFCVMVDVFLQISDLKNRTYILYTTPLKGICQYTMQSLYRSFESFRYFVFWYINTQIEILGSLWDWIKTIDVFKLFDGQNTIC